MADDDDDGDQQWSLYSAVDRDGLPSEQSVLLNRDVLLVLWPDLNLPARCRAIWKDKTNTAQTIHRPDNTERVSGSFGDIGVPTLLITGSESPADLAEVTSRTAAAISTAHVQVLAGHGHNALRSSPAVVAEVLRNWLK